MCCKALDQFLKYILSGCIYSYWIMRESTTEHSGLIRGVCVTQIPVKAVMTSCEQCRYPWRWDISENVVTQFHGFSPTLGTYYICLRGILSVPQFRLPVYQHSHFLSLAPTDNLSFGVLCICPAHCSQSHSPSHCAGRWQDMEGFPQGLSGSIRQVCAPCMGTAALDQSWLPSSWKEKSSPLFLSFNSAIWGPSGDSLRWGKLS